VFNPFDQPPSWVNPNAPEPNQLERTDSGHYKPIKELEEADRRGRGEEVNEGTVEEKGTGAADSTTAAALKQPTSGERERRGGYMGSMSAPPNRFSGDKFARGWGAPFAGNTFAAQQQQQPNIGDILVVTSTIRSYRPTPGSTQGVGGGDGSSTDEGRESPGMIAATC
jgi:hypothetical protein